MCQGETTLFINQLTRLILILSISGHTCTSDTTDFRGGVWGFTPGPAGVVTVAPAMQIRFKAADLSSLETHPLTPGLSLATPSTPVAALDPTPVIPAPGGFSTIVAPRPPVLSALPRITLSTLVQLSTISSAGSTAVSLVTRTKEITSPPDDPTGSAPSPTQPNAAVSKETSTGNPRAVTAVIVLASLLFVTILAILGFLLLRRYRRAHGLAPVGLGVWAKQSRKLVSPVAWAKLFRRKAPDPEIGTTRAPAELDGIEVGQRRWSWVLPKPRFRIFSMASWKVLSSRSSPWEKLESEKTMSPYTESFGRDKWQDGPLPPLPLPPVYQGPSTSRSTRSSPVDTSTEERLGGRAAAMARLSGFTRLSDGTFGRIGSPQGSTGTNSSRRSSQ